MAVYLEPEWSDMYKIPFKTSLLSTGPHQSTVFDTSIDVGKGEGINHGYRVSK